MAAYLLATNNAQKRNNHKNSYSLQKSQREQKSSGAHNV